MLGELGAHLTARPPRRTRSQIAYIHVLPERCGELAPRVGSSVCYLHPVESLQIVERNKGKS